MSRNPRHASGRYDPLVPVFAAATVCGLLLILPVLDRSSAPDHRPTPHCAATRTGPTAHPSAGPRSCRPYDQTPTRVPAPLPGVGTAPRPPAAKPPSPPKAPPPAVKVPAAPVIRR